MGQFKRHNDETSGDEPDYEAIISNRLDWDGADDRAEAANDRYLYRD